MESNEPKYRVEITAAVIGGIVQVLLTSIIAYLMSEDRAVSPLVIGKIFIVVLPWVAIGVIAVVFFLHRRTTDPADDETTDKVIEIARLLGITTASELKLQGSRLEPIHCIQQTKRRLDFMGVLASKWVLDPPVRKEFENLLDRLDTVGGRVRFLIADPSSVGFERLRALREGNISLDAMQWLRELSTRHTSFDVRGYATQPIFRIVMIDDAVVTFSTYHMHKTDYERSRFGWESPHAVLDPQALWPLSAVLELLFDETWASARPLEEIPIAAAG